MNNAIVCNNAIVYNNAIVPMNNYQMQICKLMVGFPYNATNKRYWVRCKLNEIVTFKTQISKEEEERRERETAQGYFLYLYFFFGFRDTNLIKQFVAFVLESSWSNHIIICSCKYMSYLSSNSITMQKL